MYKRQDYVIFTLSNGTQIKLPTWSAFEALQRLCNETNTNLSALQTIVTALQNNDYITSVDPVSYTHLDNQFVTILSLFRDCPYYIANPQTDFYFVDNRFFTKNHPPKIAGFLLLLKAICLNNTNTIL